MFAKLKERTPRLTQNKFKLLTYIALCVLIVLSLTVVPVYLWLSSDIETRGITTIRGESMSPGINNNDILYVQPVQFERGEIVVARCPNSTKYPSVYNTALLKRIVGLPGETVEITSEGVLINGVLIDEEYTINQELTLQESNDVDEIVLSDREYFLLGDNRSNSFDSRHVGAVPENNFLYGLTVEPNEYTHMIWRNMAIVAIGNLLLIIALPILLFVAMTHQKTTKTQNKKTKSTKSHQTTQNKSTINANNNVVKNDDGVSVKKKSPQPKSAKNRKKADRAAKAQRAIETQQYVQQHKKH